MGRTKSLSRTTGTRAERRTFRILTEGKVTEPAYINGFKQLDHIRSSVSIKVEVKYPNTAPLQLVERAVENARDPEVDQVWCVFDVESPKPHPNLAEAVALADRGGVHLAVSNPCFELWLALHDEACSSSITTRQVERLANGLAACSDKKIVDVAWFLDRRTIAIKNARRLDEMHQRNGTSFPKDNPSSGLPDLLEALEAAARG